MEDLDGETTRALRQVASGRAAVFSRGFAGLDAIRNAAATGEHWIVDLLSLWRPSGHAAGDWGLRLAVRGDYLNFYRKGQSIARVKLVNGELVCLTHGKYVTDVAPEAGQTYARTIDKTTELSGTTIPYNGIETAKCWISRVDGTLEKAGYGGFEKRLIDELVERNDNVVDLEMGLPSWGSRTSASRIDLVAIHEDRIVFWEVKTPGDGRIRSSKPFEEDRTPEVLLQLKGYRDFLLQDRHLEQISQAYREASRVLVTLRETADALDVQRQLGSSIIKAAQGCLLQVATEAALLVVNDGDDASSTWISWKAKHEGTLTDRVAMQVMVSPAVLQPPDRLSFL